MTNSPHIQHWLKQRQQTPCHRQLLVIAGEQSYCQNQAQSIVEQLSLKRQIWVGNTNACEGVNPPQTSFISAGQYHQFLGNECDAVIYNAFDGLRANALAALSGTLVQHGLMILLCPPLAEWPTYADPQKAQRISYGFVELAQHSHFVSWLVRHIQADAHCALLSAIEFTGKNKLLTPDATLATPPYKTKEQQQAVAAIIDSVNGPDSAPLIISADRGRGKSSALGIAAAQLLQNGAQRIMVTAPLFSSTAQLFSHAQRLLDDSKQHKQALTWMNKGIENSIEKGIDKTIEFQPVDRILAELPSADVLLVDEAAAIPAPLLQQLCEHYSNIVFASTIHGYEGSGRGFEIRFKQYLAQHFKEYETLHIQQPIRWQADDPLEAFWFKALLLKFDLCQQPYQPQLTLECEFISQQQCLDDPELLAQVFSLLVNAHYQTTPDDMVRLLDAPDCRLYVLKQNESLLGAAIIHLEGGETLSELADAICAGERRVKGHLLAQNLGLYFNHNQWVKRRYWRIVRIAILPEHQQQGLGQQFLQKLTELALAQQVTLGTAFGATDKLIRFWQKAGFEIIRHGEKRDASSGTTSVIMLNNKQTP
ncbi:GNAT family N-acetyltransferase [Alteromonadaceae bacterium BrNp21-10]|nr:GNAT family N-acetyltransferase [Alteromonadaceae bacterium BrNp21-10]